MYVEDHIAVIGGESIATGMLPSARRARQLRAIGILDGRGNFPNTPTSFDPSAMQTNLRATTATIFPRSAPRALDHRAVLGHLVSAIDVDRQIRTLLSSSTKMAGPGARPS
jgi:hypothetical protein